MFFNENLWIWPTNLVAVGAPIPVKKIANPSQQDIDDLHKTYVDTLVNLFHEHRDKYAGDNSQTIVITWVDANFTFNSVDFIFERLIWF